MARTKLHPSLVSVKRIVCDVDRNVFSSYDLKAMAKCILAMGGLISPIIVRRVGIDSYKVVAREFEYWAAVTAREMDPAAGEMINAFIVDDQIEEWAKKQITLSTLS